MASFDHDQVRDRQDRSATRALLGEVLAPSTSETARAQAFSTLASLEDYRSVGPRTAMVEDTRLAEPVRAAASKVVSGFDDTTTGEQRRRWWASGDAVKMAHALGLMERTEADIVIAVAGDGEHPLQAVALAGMSFGYAEPDLQAVKILALSHRDATIRAAAANVLVWDEPLAAEEPLLTAARDPCGDVATAAIDSLQYYPSRRVLRALTELAQAPDGGVATKARESRDYVRGRFEFQATFGDPVQVAQVREWMKPAADLLRWPAQSRERAVPTPPRHPTRVPMSERELLALVENPDGEWAAKKQALRVVAWDAYTEAERQRLSVVLTEHPDPVVREIAATPLATWSYRAELLTLATDPSFLVRKSAIYGLTSVPADPTIAAFAWDYALHAAGTAAYEALRTYVAHAPPAQAKDRLTELARTDPRESIQTTAISSLTALHAAPELESLLPLLRDPPGVTWAVHIAILDALRSLRLPAPDLDDLAAVDNLDLMCSVLAVRCATT